MPRFSCLHEKQINNIIEHHFNRGWRVPPSGAHKKGKIICYGLLLVLSTMVGLSLNVSSDVNAIQYTIDSLLIHPFAFPMSSTSSSANQVYIMLDQNVSDLNITPRNSSFLDSAYNFSTQKCEYSNSYQNPGYSATGRSIYWNGSFYPSFISSLSPVQSCHTILPYGSSNSNFSVPEFDTSSIPFNAKLNTDSLLPYNFMYYSIPFSNVRTVDGVDYSSTFDVSELLQNTVHPGDPDFTYYTDHITNLSFPLNVNPIESVPVGENLVVSGRIDFGVGLSSSDVSGLDISISVSRYYSGGADGFNLPCSLSYYDNNGSHSLAYYCSSPVPSGMALSVGQYALSLNINSTSVISSTAQSMQFSQIFITFHDDSDTFGGSISLDQAGSFPNVAPGVARVDSENGDWFSSLVSLFKFNFSNPFAPIFTMFTNTSTCANIPIIASLIHSNETQICPFFSSSVTNITTPVFSFVSVMLVFGFAVRWLSSSSGNMFEDQTSHKWSNTQFKQRGVK